MGKYHVKNLELSQANKEHLVKILREFTKVNVQCIKKINSYFESVDIDYKATAHSSVYYLIKHQLNPEYIIGDGKMNTLADKIILNRKNYQKNLNLDKASKSFQATGTKEFDKKEELKNTIKEYIEEEFTPYFIKFVKELFAQSKSKGSHEGKIVKKVVYYYDN